MEIRTKITSVFAFLWTIAFLLYTGQSIDWGWSGVFFAAMFLFDLATTAINNYIDQTEVGRELQFKRPYALAIIYALVGISASLGVFMAFHTNWVIFFLGAICFLFGILYTYGPVPISRQPLGELLSGFFYGLMIPLILLLINTPDGYYFSVRLNRDQLDLSLKLFPMVQMLLLSIPPFFATSNIMLANNICDVERDIQVKRYTLPYYLGKRALTLYAALYYAIYIAVVLMVVLRILPLINLLSLLTVFPVRKNIARFFKEQDKAFTFITAIQNYLLILGTNTLLLFLAGFFR